VPAEFAGNLVPASLLAPGFPSFFLFVSSSGLRFGPLCP
jgi:hypothetical protein